MQRITRSACLAAGSLLLMTSFAPALRAQSNNPPSDTFQTAQRHIYAAIAALQTYLQDHPTGRNATTARLQVKDLEALNTFAAAPPFVPMNGWGINWHILSIDPQEDVTHVTLEIANTSESTSAGFRALDHFPLILVDNRGQSYPSGDVGSLPDGVDAVKDQYGDPSWLLHGGQTITVTVDFPPLQPGCTGGKVLFKDSSDATPATFSLLNKKQLTRN